MGGRLLSLCTCLAASAAAELTSELPFRLSPTGALDGIARIPWLAMQSARERRGASALVLRTCTISFALFAEQQRYQRKSAQACGAHHIIPIGLVATDCEPQALQHGTHTHNDASRLQAAGE